MKIPYYVTEKKINIKKYNISCQLKNYKELIKGDTLAFLQ